MTTVYTVEVTVHNGTATEKIYLSSHPLVTTGSDTPAHTAFECRLSDPVLVKLAAYSNALTSGSSSSGVGEVIINNPDNFYGYLANYGFDGREIVVRFGELGAAYPSAFTTILLGTMVAPKFDRTKITLRIRDNHELLSKPLLTTTYAGNNSLPAGLEGVAGDIKGRVKPRVYGQVFNIPPVFVNTSRLIYQVSDNAVNSVDAVYDRGASLTKGADYTSQVDMETNAPAAGNFRAWPAGGYFRLGSSPAGEITADVTQGATTADRTVAKILNSIAGSMSVSVSSADVTALDALNSAVVGIFVDSESDAVGIMDEVANSIGAWFAFDTLGVLRMGRLEAPSGTPVLTIDENTYTKVDLVSNADTSKGVPVYRMTTNYKRFYVVQPTDLAGSVTDARKGELKNEYRQVTDEDTGVKTKYLLAEEYTNYTLLVDASAAATENTRKLNLHKVRRDRVSVRVMLDSETITAITMLAVVRLEGNIFDYSSGRDFRILGYTINAKTASADLVLWG